MQERRVSLYTRHPWTVGLGQWACCCQQAGAPLPAMTEAWSAEALAARETDIEAKLAALRVPNPRNELRLRHLPLPRCPNFRDCGGYRTSDSRHQLRFGVLYRHGRLSQTDAEERRYIDALGIKTFVDFRSDDEIAEAEAYASAGARLVAIKMQDPAGVPKRWGRRAGVTHPLAWAQVGRPPAALRKIVTPRAKTPLQAAFETNDFSGVPDLARNGMPQIYNWLVTDPYRKRDFAQFLAEACDSANLPLAFMCNAGKDRTAIGALLLFTALEVSEEDVLADYLLTNRVFGKSVTTTPLGTPDKVAADIRRQIDGMAERWSPTGDVSPYSEADLDVLTAALATISGADAENLAEATRAMCEEGGGSVLGYMRQELGFTDAMQAALQAAVLEPVQPATTSKL